MQDIRIQFYGEKGTCFKFKEKVEGKKLYKQKYLINTATSKNTDKIFPDRGTNMLAQAMGGIAMTQNGAYHIGNFAATDTIYFCSYEEIPSEYKSSSYVESYTLYPKYYNNATNSLYFLATFIFKDDETETEEMNLNFTTESR